MRPGSVVSVTDWWRVGCTPRPTPTGPVPWFLVTDLRFLHGHDLVRLGGRADRYSARSAAWLARNVSASSSWLLRPASDGPANLARCTVWGTLADGAVTCFVLDVSRADVANLEAVDGERALEILQEIVACHGVDPTPEADGWEEWLDAPQVGRTHP